MEAKLELRHLRYFVAVAEELNFTRAALKMCTVQPSLSQQIKDLEYEVGVTLIERSSRRVALTPEGEAFLPFAIQALQAAENATHAARISASKKNNCFYLGLIHVAESRLLSNIIAKFDQEQPKINVHISSSTCHKLLQKLQKSELDMTFTRYCINDEDIQSQLIFSEKIYLVFSEKLSQQKRINTEFLNTQNLILSSEESATVLFENTSLLLEKNKIYPKNTIYSDNILQHINLINMGMGWSLVPEHLLQFLDKQVKVTNPDFETFYLNMYVNFKRHHKEKIVNWLLETLNDEKMFFL